MNSAIRFVVLGTIVSMIGCFSSCCHGDKLAPLRSEIAQYTTAIPAEIGVAVLTEKGDSLTIHNGEPFPMMSVFKFHQSLAVAYYLTENQISLGDTIYVAKDEVAMDTYSPLREQYPNGDISFSIADLLRYTLQWSDNIACDILFDRFYSPLQTDSLLKSITGISDFQIKYNEAEMHDENALCYENWSSPYATVQLIDWFLKGDIIAPQYAEFIKQTMVESETGKGRIVAPMLNTDAVVGHKTGSGFTLRDGSLLAINDVGFVEFPNGVGYSVAVYVKNASLSVDECEVVIARISEMVYDYFAKKSDNLVK